MSQDAGVRGRGLISPNSAWGSRLRFVLFLAGWVLAGEMLTQGLCDELAPTRPGLAVIWRSDSADALAQQASSLAETGRTTDAIVFARRSLQLSPLQPIALSSFALALDGAGVDPPRAEQMMSVAGAQGWRNREAQAWLTRRRLAEGDYADGFARADAAVRVSPEIGPDLFGAMTAALQSPAAVAPLAARLAAGPSWRSHFLAALAADPRAGSEPALFGLLSALKAGGHPPTNDELALYPERLIAEGRVPDAQRAWRTLSNPAGGTGEVVYDGDFSQPVGPGPFDWVLRSGVGWTVSIGPSPGTRGSALAIDYDGFSRPAPLGQHIVAAPGAGRLTGRIFAETAAGSERMRWIVICDGSRREIGDTGPIAAVAGRWTPFETTFAATGTDCASQWLVLTANGADAPTEIQVWFDDMSVSAAPATARAAP